MGPTWVVALQERIVVLLLLLVHELLDDGGLGLGGELAEGVVGVGIDAQLAQQLWSHAPGLLSSPCTAFSCFLLRFEMSASQMYAQSQRLSRYSLD